MEPYRKRLSNLARVLMLVSVLLAANVRSTANAEDNGGEESTRLAALLRQLDLADDIAQRASESDELSDARIRFDYARLHADLARIRKGIEDYLTPHRAQPRDPVTIDGDYRSSASAASH